ncbi:hypothetical protein KGF54_004160 [Candida jiufengensis]|uniref:uncharacterized protein n=1 Tax=Candida jiufengensis TaxID=497108 RepID=UPI0022252911|nr:uncharacterized protein KGF54_004160 [Candida jiufengensis]KAI5951086.1 hypothetical protein KGF54_004160 [Candida jiufengensis]
MAIGKSTKTIKTRTSKKYTEQDIVKALALLKEDSSISVNSVAKRFHIPQRTLQNRVSGTRSRQESHQKQQILTPRQEYQLATYLVACNDKHQGLSRAEVVEEAQAILKADGQDIKIGKHWCARFMVRHDVLKSMRAAIFEDSKALSCDKDE